MSTALNPAPARAGNARYAAAWPTPFSFAHSFVRYAGQLGITVDRTHWEIDDAGRGVAAYRAVLGERTYSFVVALHMLDPSEHQDRIIATKWDATSVLVDGEASHQDFDAVTREVPNVLWGRATRRTLVWSRANRSVRLFEHTRQELAAGRQPHPDQLTKVGYLFRTTGFSANGRNGMVDYAALVEGAHPLRGAYHAQMLAAYLWRELSCDLVDDLALRSSPTAATLAPRVRRYLGIGNSSGIGLAPFVVRHPLLIDHWITQVFEALEVVGRLSLAEPARAAEEQALGARLRELLDQAIAHFREQPAGTYEHFSPGSAIAADLRIAQRVLAQPAVARGTVRELLDSLTPRVGLESLEAVHSLILEATVDAREVDRLDAMTVDETLQYEGSMQCGVLLRQLRERFSWACSTAAASRSGDYYFWYYSEEHMEPRRGEPGADPGEEYAIPLDIVGRLQLLESALLEMDPTQPVAKLILGQPDLHYIVSWVQTMSERPNALLLTDFLARDFVPLDVMRFQLAIYGMLRMRPSSPNQLRGTVLQGAPLPHELTSDSAMPTFPIAPGRVGAS